MQLALIGSPNLFRSNSKFPLRGCRVLAAMLLFAPLSSAMAGTLYIGGNLAATITAHSHHYFRPWIAGSDKATAKFAIRNKPHSIVASSCGSTSPPPTNGAPTISGSTASVTAVGTAFSFQPTASDPAGRKLTFSVNTKPSWTSFDSTTGRLYGTPGAANVGTTSNIVITANDGTASASLKAFSLTVTQIGNGSATLSWMPPTTNTNGAVLRNLAGYQIKYGTNSAALSQTIQIANPGLTTYVITNLSPGTYYFGTLAYTSTGTQSKLSSLASKTIH
jgi:hypothetical protein